MVSSPILAIPPFPGARPPCFASPGGSGQGEPAELLSALARHRVGGCYWGAHIPLPVGDFILDGTDGPSPGALNWDAACDPWPMLDAAVAARLPESDPRGLLALAAGVPLTLVAADGSERAASDDDRDHLLTTHLTGWNWINPFSLAPMSPIEAITRCGEWRRLIDANRQIQSVMGIAYWKKPTVTPLLWGGSKVPYGRGLHDLPERSSVAIWRARLSASQQRAIAEAQPAIIEIEDGFIRSAGLGADCVPPLSIIVDGLGIHFDPNRPSELEDLLQHAELSEEVVVRAATLRAAIVSGGLSKYESAAPRYLERPGGTRWHVLVPGQVEDDRAVTSGGALSSNLELLRGAREHVGPDAFVIYKPHPDVLAGHRRGLLSPADMAALADCVETETPMARLIDMVDELHVNSSLAGFEALMRGKRVTVHGVPFYAGWGLTTDLSPVPPRRTRRRSLDELVAAALLLYPRYLDPETNLPCPVEVLVWRLTGSRGMKLGLPASIVVAIRRFYGRILSGIRHG